MCRGRFKDDDSGEWGVGSGEWVPPALGIAAIPPSRLPTPCSAGTILLPTLFTLRPPRRGRHFAATAPPRRRMTRTLEPTAPTVARTTSSIAPAAAARRCRTVAACAFEYLDGELGPALAAAVAEHLTACSACRRRLDRDRALLD